MRFSSLLILVFIISACNFEPKEKGLNGRISIEVMPDSS